MTLTYRQERLLRRADRALSESLRLCLTLLGRADGAMLVNGG